MNVLLSYSLLVMTFGCAAPGIDRIDENQIIKEFYATIIAVTLVEFSSEAETGAVIGADVEIIDFFIEFNSFCKNSGANLTPCLIYVNMVIC